MVAPSLLVPQLLAFCCAFTLAVAANNVTAAHLKIFSFYTGNLATSDDLVPGIVNVRLNPPYVVRRHNAAASATAAGDAVGADSGGSGRTSCGDSIEPVDLWRSACDGTKQACWKDVQEIKGFTNDPAACCTVCQAHPGANGYTLKNTTEKGTGFLCLLKLCVSPSGAWTTGCPTTPSSPAEPTLSASVHKAQPPHPSPQPPPALQFNFSSIDDSFAKYNMSSFLGVTDVGVWRGRSGVLPGWQANIAAAVKAASSRLASGVVGGLFLGDEIVCGGMPVSNLSAVAAFCKQQLTAAGHAHALVYVNECKPSFTKPTGIKMVPAGLDIISFDSYELSNRSSFQQPWWLQEPLENRAFAANVIVPKLHPHQRLMVVPGLYGNDTGTPEQHAIQVSHPNMQTAVLRACIDWV